jgi:hypothetical protein
VKKRAKKLFSQPDKAEARARRRAAKTLPKGFSIDEVTETIENDVSEYRLKNEQVIKSYMAPSVGSMINFSSWTSIVTSRIFSSSNVFVKTSRSRQAPTSAWFLFGSI